jgi:hypothetical protein
MRALGIAFALLALFSFVMPPSFADDLTVTVVSITPTVSHDESSTLVINTKPGATCSADIIGNHAGGGKPGAQGTAANGGRLPERTANAQGAITWKWKTIGTAGHRTVQVTCKSGTQTGTVNAEFDVTG